MNRLPPNLWNNLKDISDFFEYSQRYSEVKVHHWDGINDTSGKYSTGINDTDGKFATCTAGIIDTGDKSASGK